MRANQMAAPRGPYDWQRVGVALAEAGATVVRADRAEASYAVRFAQGPNAATRVSRLMARRRAQAQTYRVVLASNVLTVEPGQAASPLVAGLRSQLR